MSGRLEIILGCMFSGKSTELIRRISRYNAIKLNTIVINSKKDTRCEHNAVKTHNNVVKKALKVNNLMDILTNSETLKIYKNSEVIGIDEAQFFPDLLEFILKTETDNKIIIIAGLDGDSNRKPFGQILNCIPLCDEVTKLTAMDMISKDGTPAIFTKRLINNKQQICVGADNEYAAVSRTNYLK